MRSAKCGRPAGPSHVCPSGQARTPDEDAAAARAGGARTDAPRKEAVWRARTQASGANGVLAQSTQAGRVPSDTNTTGNKPQTSDAGNGTAAPSISIHEKNGVPM